MNELTIGELTISPSVMASIVTMGAEKVEGVAYVNGHNMATSLVSLITAKPTVTEDTVCCEVVDGKVNVNVPVAVFFGYPFTELAEAIRQAVAETVKTQIGIEVGEVNITIDELVFPRE